MCEYCKGWEDEDILYGENAYCDICIGKVFNHPNLILKDIRRGCPRYSDCIGKLNVPKVAFAIRYCPNCGQKLEKQIEKHDCRDCKKWLECPNGMRGHIKGTSIGFSIGECADFIPKQTDT